MAGCVRSGVWCDLKAKVNGRVCGTCVTVKWEAKASDGMCVWMCVCPSVCLSGLDSRGGFPKNAACGDVLDGFLEI